MDKDLAAALFDEAEEEEEGKTRGFELLNDDFVVEVCMYAACEQDKGLSVCVCSA